MKPALFTFSNLVQGGAFFTSLFSYLRHPVDLASARAGLQRRLAGRDQAFLDKLRHDVFSHPSSPYLALFQNAGCAFGDVERMLRSSGLEQTLHQLFRGGVYLTIDEFKGRSPIQRGALTLPCAPDDFRSPRAAHHVAASSGGSRSAGTPVLIDLRFVRTCASNCLLFLDARGGRDWIKGTWEVPGAGARFRLTKYAGFGAPPAAWFSQVDPNDPALPPVFRLNTYAMLATSRVARVPLPKPVLASTDDPLPVAKWLNAMVQAKRTPHLFTFPSSAVALCRTAIERGIDLTGAHFTLSGEPITQARLNTVRRAGAQALPRYGSIENGAIGYGCQNPAAPDDVHLLADQHALIYAGEPMPSQALLLTNLHPQSPFVFLNACMGDEAVIEPRSCGCPLEQLGWTTHLREIRSYEKLTGAGVTFLGAEVIRVMEEVLPRHFGGCAIDYQLCEDEAPDGQAILALLVNPSLGPIDEPRVLEVFLEALAADSPAHRVMERMLRQSGALRVERRTPISSQAGKILHFHLLKRQAVS